MATGLTVDPRSPQRLLYNDCPIFLITGTEHYGAVVNGAFDYDTYLDVLAETGLNMTRIFSYYREITEFLGSALGYANTLAPRPDQYISPLAADRPGNGPGRIAQVRPRRMEPRIFHPSC